MATTAEQAGQLQPGPCSRHPSSSVRPKECGAMKLMPLPPAVLNRWKKTPWVSLLPDPPQAMTTCPESSMMTAVPSEEVADVVVTRNSVPRASPEPSYCCPTTSRLAVPFTELNQVTMNEPELSRSTDPFSWVFVVVVLTRNSPPWANPSDE